MSTEEDLPKAEDELAAPTVDIEPRALETSSDDDDDGGEPDEDGHASSPIQFGYQRFVYGAYMAGAMFVAFLVAKIGHASWLRLEQWRPTFGDPRDEIVYPLAGLVGVFSALYFWRKPSSREFANEVAEELSKVTWPNKKEVWNSTTVVIVTTLAATLFFALMDQFWKYVTDRIFSS